MKKAKYLSLIFCVICIFILSATSVFADKSDVIVSLQIDNPTMCVNGVEAEIDVGRRTMPVVINGRTLVPIRAIIEAFGGEVGWDDASQSVLLAMEDDSIKLTINSSSAVLNGKHVTLDVAPTVINGRTMLPIRFVAEGFNLGVAWDAGSQTVSIIRDTFNKNEYTALMNALPDYSGAPYTTINNNIPYFKDYEIINGSFEYYADLDDFGRCDVCFASIATDLMPKEERESISNVTPTGWINAKYDNVDGGYVYNRCHLIGFQLTGENANERNLITGTRYLNVDGMLPFENIVADYIESTGARVMYRVTPVFKENNLVVDGVLIEAYSVADRGASISFCVYCYNVQPQIYIDYKTGETYLEINCENPTPDLPQTNPSVKNVYRTPTGKKYHTDAECGGKNSYAVTIEAALDAGLTPCAKCAD